VSNLEQEFAAFVESDHARPPGVRHVKNVLSARDRDRRDKTEFAEPVPAAPFLLRTIQESDCIGRSIGDTEVLVFIERDAKRLEQGLAAFVCASEQASKAAQA